MDGPIRLKFDPPSHSPCFRLLVPLVCLLLMTSHALEDKAMTCYLFQRFLQIASTKYALYAVKRPM